MQSGLRINQFKSRRGSFEVSIPKLEVKSGEITCLVGKSGSGKSSVLLGISGFSATEGEIYRAGEAVQAFPPEKRKIALVFQQNSLFLKMTVSENIEFPLKIQRVEKKDRDVQVKAWMERLKINHLASHRAGTLSGGETQRVQLARAFATGFKVFLLDEPFSALDVPLRRELRELTRNLVRETGTAALFVTHDPEDIRMLADSVCVIDAGKVTFQGSVKEALASSQSYLKEIF